MRSMRSAVVGPWACFRLMTVFINLRLVPFQLFASNSLLGHPTANRRLFGPNLSPDQVGTALVHGAASLGRSRSCSPADDGLRPVYRLQGRLPGRLPGFATL